jgi:hypothetical protein
MSGKSTAAVSQSALSQGTASHTSKADASARWAALDSRHERLVTASDGVLADPDRKNDHLRAAS